MTFSIEVNQQVHSIEADPQTPLLWILREKLGLTGTKYSCGIGQCGACTVHLDDKSVRSCRITISEASGHKITTIEGLSSAGNQALQKAWLEGQVPQCGYCQPGQIMQAASLLMVNPNPTREEIIDAMSGNLCRCGSYQRILNAVQHVVEAGGGS